MTQDEIKTEGELVIGQPKPNIEFHQIEQPKCVMRIESDRIWVDPDIEVTEAARVVIESLESHIKMLISAEREACAKEAEVLAAKEYNGGQQRMPIYYAFKDCAAAIRARK